MAHLGRIHQQRVIIEERNIAKLFSQKVTSGSL
jgi:hypothetical protein